MTLEELWIGRNVRLTNTPAYFADPEECPPDPSYDGTILEIDPASQNALVVIRGENFGVAEIWAQMDDLAPLDAR